MLAHRRVCLYKTEAVLHPQPIVHVPLYYDPHFLNILHAWREVRRSDQRWKVGAPLNGGGEL